VSTRITSPTGADIPGELIHDLQYLQQLSALNGGQANAYFDALSAHPSGFFQSADLHAGDAQCRRPMRKGLRGHQQRLERPPAYSVPAQVSKP